MLQLGPSGFYANQSHASILDHRCLDGHLLPTIQQPEGMAARRGEENAEVHYKVQKRWHLNILAQGYVKSEGCKLR